MTTEIQTEQNVKLNKKGDRRGMHPNARKALEENRKPTPWKPGQSGNKKGYSITSRLRDMMWEVCPDDEEGRIWGEVETEAVLRQALTKPEAMKTLLDRHEGKQFEHTGINLNVENLSIRVEIGTSSRLKPFKQIEACPLEEGE